MKEFYFDIKARVNDSDDSFSKWSWPPVWSGRIDATDQKEARKKIEEEYQRKFIMRDGKNVKDEPFLLSIKPMTPYLAKRFEKINCQMCDIEYTVNEAYILGLRDSRFCSYACKEEYNATIELQKLNENNVSFYNYSTPPVIYSIKNVKNDMCYVGKSVRSFTLRWWEHLKIAMVHKSASSKFHLALKDSEISDWEFKVLEVIKYPNNIMSNTEKDKYILERETHWMKELDTIEKGYNSLESLKRRE